MRLWRLAVFLGMVFSAHLAQAQVVSSVQPRDRDDGQETRLGVEIKSGDNQLVVLRDSAIVRVPDPIDIAVSWKTHLSSVVHVYGYFFDPVHALVGPGSGAIGAPEIDASVDEKSWAPFRSLGELPGAVNLFYASPVTGGAHGQGETDVRVWLRYNLLDRVVPAGRYTGVMNVQAVVY